ncbi:MAG TPA: DUF3857 domain-containing protein, partial [Puia sp.]|nr:DUF3857 domain-containing protein [Puia sp.]
MKKLFYILLLTPCGLRAQNYSTALIPDSLRKGAEAVLREEDVVLEIKSPGRAVEKKREVYTILNANGDDEARYASGYDKFTSIGAVEGVLYDSLGKVIRRAKRKDMQDLSYVAESTLATDDRYLLHSFYYQVYPYTVDYQEEEDLNGIEGFDDWLLLNGPDIATQHTKYVVIAPSDYTVRYLGLNGAPAPTITEEKDKKIYTWEAWNLPARKTESHGPQWREIAPYVMIGPSDFEEQGYKGNMTSWTDYGKFIQQLREGRDLLPENIKQQVHALVDTITDAHRKVYALYRYLQQNTHYISIQLGIGGLQPFPADYVATKRYGDCKALANYMVALLKEAGIKGKYVEIEAGANATPLVEKFPCHQFNHAISCVPLDKDTIWLECTDQTESPNYMGAFTGGRKALLSDEDGGHVVTTPSYSAADNTQCRVVHAQVSADGNLDAEVHTVYHCVRQDGPQGWMDDASEADRRKHLNELFDLPTYSVDKSHYEEQQGSQPVVKEDLHLVANNYASVSGKRLFLNPNVFD